MAYVEISPESRLLIQAIANGFSEPYARDTLIPALARACKCQRDVSQIKACLLDPYVSLRVIYCHYAFSRRGKDREELELIAKEALDFVKGASISSFLQQANANSLWKAFETACEVHRRKPTEQVNLGVVAGLAELAQEIYRLDGVGSIPGWISAGVRSTGRLEPQFLRMVDVRGIGPKLASLLIRDVVFLEDLEDVIEPADRLYTQVIDRWVRTIAPSILLEEDLSDAADWILAGKICKYCRVAQVSGIAFNMGCTYYGTSTVRYPDRVVERLTELLESRLAR